VRRGLTSIRLGRGQRRHYRVLAQKSDRGSVRLRLAWCWQRRGVRTRRPTGGGTVAPDLRAGVSH